MSIRELGNYLFLSLFALLTGAWLLARVSSYSTTASTTTASAARSPLYPTTYPTCPDAKPITFTHDLRLTLQPNCWTQWIDAPKQRRTLISAVTGWYLVELPDGRMILDRADVHDDFVELGVITRYRFRGDGVTHFALQ